MMPRSTYHYKSRLGRQELLRMRLKDLAYSRVSYGYRRLHILLRREGWMVNHKRIYRLYVEEGLTLKRRKPKRHKAYAARHIRVEPTGADDIWSIDFMSDQLADGSVRRQLKVDNAYIESFNGRVRQECLSLH
ncbi:hypothetical protein E3V36_06840 [Candidatus Marinimicrobia bacterium MT.SAG.2]|nr:hypothetical protein E3V36_06840 [Candidatus Marinimicrobia bacterium MT.SAG.2]